MDNKNTVGQVAIDNTFTNYNAESVATMLGYHIHVKCQEWAIKKMQDDDFISPEDANLNFKDSWRDREIVKSDFNANRAVQVLRNSKKSEYYKHYEKKLFSMLEEFVNLLAVVDKLKGDHE